MGYIKKKFSEFFAGFVAYTIIFFFWFIYSLGAGWGISDENKLLLVRVTKIIFFPVSLFPDLTKNMNGFLIFLIPSIFYSLLGCLLSVIVKKLKKKI